TEGGARWAAQVFRDNSDGEEQIAIVHGKLDPERPALVRMHSLDIFADVFGEAGERTGLLHGAMRMIEQAGAGVIVALRLASPTAFSLSLDQHSGKPVEHM